jgi:hypothetical protein
LKCRWGVVILLIATLALVAPVVAQDSPLSRMRFGPATMLFTEHGEYYGTIILIDIFDPFEGFEPATSAPEAGFHWVMVSLVWNPVDGPVGRNAPFDYKLTDRDGFTSYGQSPRLDGSIEHADPFAKVRPEIDDTLTELVVFFQVYDEADIVLIEHIYNGRHTAILDKWDRSAEPGSAIDWIGSDGDLLGEFMVEGIVDPIPEDPSSPVGPGFRTAGVVVTFRNLCAKPISIGSYLFEAIDANGYYVDRNPVSINRVRGSLPPDFASTPVAPGETVTGLVAFRLEATAAIGTVMYSPTRDQSIRLVKLGDLAASCSFRLMPVATATPELDPCT